MPDIKLTYELTEYQVGMPHRITTPEYLALTETAKVLYRRMPAALLQREEPLNHIAASPLGVPQKQAEEPVPVKEGNTEEEMSFEEGLKMFLDCMDDLRKQNTTTDPQAGYGVGAMAE